MKLIFWSRRRSSFAVGRGAAKIAFSFAFFFAGPGPLAAAQAGHTAGEIEAQFKRTVQALSAARLEGNEDNQAQMESALAYLDSIALGALNASPTPDLAAGNARLAALVSHTPPVGENYRLAKLGGESPVYAMVINFGLGGSPFGVPQDVP